MQEKSNTDCTN